MTLPERDQYLTPTSPLAHIYPLTYDELDQNDQHQLTRLGAGPHVTPEGFCANGVDSRYSATILTEGALAELSLYCCATVSGELRHATRDVIVSLTHPTNDQPKLELCVVPDAADSSQPQIALRSYNGSIVRWYLNRPRWRFEFRFPEPITGTTLGLPAPQGLCFTDADTLLLAAHREEAITVLYRVDLVTGEYTGRCTSTEYIHLNSLHVRSNGEVWANCRVTSLGQNRMIQLDLPSSFSTGTLAISASWETTGLSPSIAFATIGGTEYVLCQEWSPTGTPWLYVFTAAQMSAPVTAGDRVKRFSLGTYIQDGCWRTSDGLFYVSRNRRTGDASNKGWIEAFDVAAAITASADGATLSPVSSHPHASSLCEGIGFRPGDDRVWGTTEGLLTVGDHWSHVAVWSSALSGQAEESQYLVDFGGVSQLLQVRANGRLILDTTFAPSVAPTRLSIGAPPGAAAGWANGFLTAGILHTVAWKDGAFSLDELDDLQAGVHELDQLDAIAVSLVNPGGESGTSGWTDELSGLLGIRTAGPAPYEGAGYFAGGNSANNRARQRFTLTALGVDPAEYSELWARVSWQQASWDGASDPGGVGVRTLDATPAQIALLPSTEVSVTPSQAWRPRAYSVALGSAVGFDVLQHRTRTVGVNVDCYVDDLHVTLYGKPIAP